MLFKEITCVYSENREKQKIISVAKMSCFNVKAGGTCSNHYSLKQIADVSNSRPPSSLSYQVAMMSGSGFHAGISMS
jgi:hypothetical protein